MEYCPEKFDIIIVGAGPAGSTAAIYLKRYGYNVCLIEKKTFPRETLCGEFLSKEVIEILQDLNLLEKFLRLCPNPVNFIKLVDENATVLKSHLGFTAYGLRRGEFDQLLLSEAKSLGVNVIQPARVEDISGNAGAYRLKVSLKEYKHRTICSDIVICAFGKQNSLDKQLKREYFQFRSALNGVKFHVPIELCNDFPLNEITIYSSPGIYCGVNAVDKNTVTFCFLEDRKILKEPSRKSLHYLKKNNKTFSMLFNPAVEKYIKSAPVYGVGHIFFGRKELTTGGIIMVGDAARVIAPLAGDGIAIALQSSALVARIIRDHFSDGKGVISILYESEWKKKFRKRIIVANLIQKTIMKGRLKFPALLFAKIFPSAFDLVIKSTRG